MQYCTKEYGTQTEFLNAEHKSAGRERTHGSHSFEQKFWTRVDGFDEPLRFKRPSDELWLHRTS